MGRGGRVDRGDVPLSLSLSVTQTRGRATNGLFFQSFLAPAVFLFFICVLGSYSFIHVPSFLLSLFLPPPPSFLLRFIPSNPPPSLLLSSSPSLAYLLRRPCSSCTRLNWRPCRCPPGPSSTVEACPRKLTWARTRRPPMRIRRATRAEARRRQARPR